MKKLPNATVSPGFAIPEGGIYLEVRSLSEPAWVLLIHQIGEATGLSTRFAMEASIETLREAKRKPFPASHELMIGIGRSTNGEVHIRSSAPEGGGHTVVSEETFGKYLEAVRLGNSQSFIDELRSPARRPLKGLSSP